MTAPAPWRPGGTSLYVHVPYCRSKCAYCDFTSRAGVLSAAGAHAYVDTILSRISQFGEVLDDIPTIYVGGGTPTLLGAELPRLVGALCALPGVREDAEVTCEANPDSMTPELLAAIAGAGVTRVSLGVQSLDDRTLKVLGRRHDATQALGAMRDIRDARLRLSADLMVGIPWQSDESVAASAGSVAEFADHASVYPLTIEDGTPMASAVMRGEMPDADSDVAARQMELAADVLGGAGLARYEVASYARPGHRSIHNSRYWTGGSYLGFGPSAASMLTAPQACRTVVAHHLDGELPDDTRVRFVLDDLPDGLETLTAEEAAREDAMLGLRLTEGIRAELVTASRAGAVLAALAEEGLVAHEDLRWRTTQRGWLMGNRVFGMVWAGE